MSGVAGLGPATSGASSHREAPLIGGDPRADNTDVYAFVSPDDANSVTLLANWIPFEEPNGGPNFYPFATDAGTTSTSTTTVTRRRPRSTRWEFTDHIRDDAGQFLYNTGPVNLKDDDAQLLPDLRPDRRPQGRRAKVLVKDAVAAPSNVGTASMPNYGALRNEAVKSVAAAARRSPARPTTRSSSTSACSTCSTART